MKSKSRRVKVMVMCLSLVLSAVIFSAGYLSRLRVYENMDSEKLSEKLSGMSLAELFDEINAVSQEGVEYPGLNHHAGAVMGKIDEVSESLLVKTIVNKRNNANLRMLCAELLRDRERFQVNDEDAAKLEAVLLDEKENSAVRSYVLWALPENESTSKALETVIGQENEALAEQALKCLNLFNPARTRPIAERWIVSGEQGGKLRMAIQTINYQMRYSDDVAEKDEWVAFLVGSLQEMKDVPEKDISEKGKLRNVIVYSLEELMYSKALYEIINSKYISNQDKAFAISFNEVTDSVLSKTLKDSPTDYDIEMIMKAMDINPLATAGLVEPLRAAIDKSQKHYDISGLIERVNNAIVAEEQ